MEKADIEYLSTEIPNAIEQSLEGVERIAKIVGAMKEFSHPGTKDKSWLISIGQSRIPLLCAATNGST